VNVPTLLTMPPFSTTPSHPTNTQSTFYIANATAASLINFTGIYFSSSSFLILKPIPAGIDSVTITLN
jgi:hypothetical protein